MYALSNEGYKFLLESIKLLHEGYIYWECVFSFGYGCNFWGGGIIDLEGVLLMRQ